MKEDLYKYLLKEGLFIYYKEGIMIRGEIFKTIIFEIILCTYFCYSTQTAGW